jgi:hypothetical protein
MTEMERYNRYVEQEDRAIERLRTLESCLYSVFDHIYRYGERFDRNLELLHLRLEKAYLAYVLNPRKPQS